MTTSAGLPLRNEETVLSDPNEPSPDPQRPPIEAVSANAEQLLGVEPFARVHDVPNGNTVFTGPRLTELRFRVQKK